MSSIINEIYMYSHTKSWIFVCVCVCVGGNIGDQHTRDWYISHAELEIKKCSN